MAREVLMHFGCCLLREYRVTRIPALFLLSLIWFVAVLGTSADEDIELRDLNHSAEEYSAEERSHWSLLNRSNPAPPEFSAESDRQWIRTPVDAFVLRKLRAAGLQPAPPADRPTLIRRVYFDLIGLPPSAEAIQQFADDDSPTAFRRLINELLASPRYGERWGQHWLDVVRFAETEGFEYDRHHAAAWRFRDYVINAFNSDKPYDRFIMEQLAGDEMEFAAGDETDRRAAQIAAGFHRLGPIRRNAGNPEVAFSRNEVLTEMTNIVGTTFLGLTLGCARCHDHMYDPIRQKDYYQLQAFMAATHANDIPQADEKTLRRWTEQTERIQVEIASLTAKITESSEDDRQRLNDRLKELQAQLPAPLPTLFSVKNDFANRTPVHLLEQGDEFRKSVPLGMRTLGILRNDAQPNVPDAAPYPRFQLASWITNPDHPLPARVMVNRIWHDHFGRGIVATVNDLGVNGDAPSHPELLDYLAERFIRNGWSVKSVHRLILLSNTYQQSSNYPSATEMMKVDADNRLLSHFRRRRLEAEEIRDAMLFVANRLNTQSGGPSIMVPVDHELIGLLYKPTQWQVTPDATQHDRRSIYLIAKRNLRLPFLEVFDQPDLQTSCGHRVSSTHAPQALEMLNGRLSNQLAAALAERLQREAGGDPADQVRLAFSIIAGRPPTSKQETDAIEFLETGPLREFALAMFSLNSFLYVD
ncbi:MAG: DUF1549 and DUF1553 domain-containing protein [Planctomycetaceae bacterium]